MVLREGAPADAGSWMPALPFAGRRDDVPWARQTGGTQWKFPLRTSPVVIPSRGQAIVVNPSGARAEHAQSRGIAIVPTEGPLFRENRDSSTSGLRPSLGMTGFAPRELIFGAPSHSSRETITPGGIEHA